MNALFDMSILRCCIPFVLVVLCGIPASGQKPDLLQDANLRTLGCAAPDTKYAFVGSNQPGNVFYPEHSVNLRITVTRTDQPPRSVTLELTTDEDRVPVGFHAMPETDYEYSVYACNDGGSELWRLLAPGIPRGHHYPRQPRAKLDQGPVSEAKHVVRHQRAVTTYELAISWSEMQQWTPKPGQKLGFTFRVNNNQAPALLFGAGKSAVKNNGLALHPYWEGKPGCSVQWALCE